MILAILGIIVQFYSRKMRESEKPKHLVWIQYSAMILITVLSAYSQFDASQKNQAYKSAKLEIDVLSKISEKYTDVLEELFKIQNNFLIVKNWLSFEKARRENPDLAEVIDWYRVASEQQLSEMESVKESLIELKQIAANVIKLGIEYEGLIPNEVLVWANTTLEMRLENIVSYLDPYAPIGKQPKASVINYMNLTGKAFGLVIGNIKRAVNTIQETD